jgi:hypothetical protein
MLTSDPTEITPRRSNPGAVTVTFVMSPLQSASAGQESIVKSEGDDEVTLPETLTSLEGAPPSWVVP